MSKNNSDTQEEIFIKDFIDTDKIYAFVPSTGVYKILSSKEVQNVPGWASERMIGICNREKVFIAVYPYKEALMLWIDGRQIDLRTNGNTIKRKQIFPFIYHLTMIQNNRILWDFKYHWVTFESWPDDGDIFTYLVEQVVDTPESIEQVFFIMTTILQGRSTTAPGFQAEMKDFVQRRLHNIEPQ